MPAACRQRLLDVAATGLRLRSSPARRTFLVQLWGAGDDAGTAPFDELVGHSLAMHQTCLVLTSGQGGTERLRRAGFTPAGDAPAGPDGRPALVAWELPA